MNFCKVMNQSNNSLIQIKQISKNIRNLNLINSLKLFNNTTSKSFFSKTNENTFLKVNSNPNVNSCLSKCNSKVKKKKYYFRLDLFEDKKTKEEKFEKLILRGKLLSKLHKSIVLTKKKYNLLNAKYNSESNTNRKRNNSYKLYSITSKYQDYYFTPKEFIEKNFSFDERKLMFKEPEYFGLNKFPFKDEIKTKGNSLSEILNKEESLSFNENNNKIHKLNIKFSNLKKNKDLKKRNMNNKLLNRQEKTNKKTSNLQQFIYNVNQNLNHNDIFEKNKRCLSSYSTRLDTSNIDKLNIKYNETSKRKKLNFDDKKLFNLIKRNHLINKRNKEIRIDKERKKKELLFGKRIGNEIKEKYTKNNHHLRCKSGINNQ